MRSLVKDVRYCLLASIIGVVVGTEETATCTTPNATAPMQGISHLQRAQYKNNGNGMEMSVDNTSAKCDCNQMLLQAIGSSDSASASDAAIRSAITRQFSSLLAKSQAVAPFDCRKYPGAIQVLQDGPDGMYKAKQLDIATGEYSDIYEIPTSRTEPKFGQLNSCSINPIDSIAYCTVLMPGSANGNIVRMDATSMEFVAKLPPGNGFNAGGFGANGAYFLRSGSTAYAFNDLASAEGYLSHEASGLRDLSGVSGYKSDLGGSADIVAFTADLEETGQKREWLVWVTSSTVSLTYADLAAKKTWKLKCSGCAAGGYGAGWNFENSVFFSNNPGEGVYELDFTNVDLTKGTISAKRVSSSAATDKNDGMNCLDAPNPFPEEEDDDDEVTITTTRRRRSQRRRHHEWKCESWCVVLRAKGCSCPVCGIPNCAACGFCDEASTSGIGL